MKKKIILIVTLILFMLLGFWQKFYAFTPLETAQRTIKVHVDGAVYNPGVYELSDEGRLQDAINLAGGLLENADTSRLNYAQRLLDGEKITVVAVIPEDPDAGEGPKKSGIHALGIADWTSIRGIGDKTAQLIMDYLESDPTATIDDLINVSGIGPAKLEDIKSALEP